jgi:hypothetical protein
VSLALNTKVLRTRNGNKKNDPRTRAQRTRAKSLSSHYLLGVEMGLGEALILLYLCLVLIALALVLNVKSEKTWMPRSVVVGGIYSPNHQSGRRGGCLSMGAPDSPVRHRTLSGAPGTSPNR